MANLNEAVQLIRQGHKDEARRILEPLLKADPTNVQTWFWYVETCSTLEQRLKTLEICLKVNPGNPQALQALQTLRTKQAAAGQVAATPQPAPAPPAARNDEPPDWARRSIQTTPPVTPAQPIAPPPSAFRSTSAFEFDEHEPEPAHQAVFEEAGSASKPAFDWDALEQGAGNNAAPAVTAVDVPVTPEKAHRIEPKSKPRGAALPFHKVWLTALTTQDAGSYAELLDDPEAGAGRAFEWTAYAGAATGLLMPVLFLSFLVNPSLAALRSSSEFKGLMNGTSLPMILLVLGLGMAVIFPIQSMLNLAITGWLQNLLAILFGGKGTFSRTVYALAAYQSPFMVLTMAVNIIPVIGSYLAIPLSVYSLVLNVRALEATHQLTAVRALMVIFAPGILNFILCCLLGVIFGPGLMDSIRSSGY